MKPQFQYIEKFSEPLNSEKDNSQIQQVFFLFHGFGADAYDLQTLAEVITPPKATHFIFPQGPLSVPIGPGWSGRAWWNIDWNRKIEDIPQTTPPELSSLREIMLTWIEGFGYRWDQVILGGFSQGAMLATDLALSAPSLPKGLVVLSGSLLNKPEWKEKIKTRAQLKFFLSHGRRDPVLPEALGSQLESLFRSNGLQGKTFWFDGTHEITPAVISSLNEHLKSL